MSDSSPDRHRPAVFLLGLGFVLAGLGHMASGTDHVSYWGAAAFAPVLILVGGGNMPGSISAE